MKQKQKRKHLESTYSLQTAKKSREFWKSQEDAPETCVVVPAWRQAAGENSSASEYLSCISSACKLILDGNRQLHQDTPFPGSSTMPLPKGLEQGKTSSAFSHVYFPSHLAKRPFMSSAHMKEERVIKIYYMYVQMKRGVAISWDGEKELEPSQTKTSIKEMTFPERIHPEVDLSLMSTKEFLIDSESSLDSKGQEDREEARGLAEPPALEENRARTPDWLVALDSGFRCMACCRVFPSVEALQKHVQHGVSEGFSCHVFHLAMAWL
uniref:Family with sequence similarity 170 member A n=1 Tax=Otolemur garnettii TaxID=30611 RepID=H0XKS1_OTOGA